MEGLRRCLLRERMNAPQLTAEQYGLEKHTSICTWIFSTNIFSLCYDFLNIFSRFCKKMVCNTCIPYKISVDQLIMLSVRLILH